MSFIDIFKEKYYFRKGQKSLTTGNFSKAFDYFQKAVLLNSSETNIFYLAISLMAQRNYAHAEEYFQKVYQKFPENEINALSYAECLLMQKKWRQAIEIYRKLVSDFPQKSKYAEFLQRAENVVEREKYVKSKLLFNAAEEMIRDKDSEKAVKLLEEALQLNPNEANIANNLGSLYFARKDFPNAYRFFEKAVTMAPHNRKFRKNFSLVKKSLRK